MKAENAKLKVESGGRKSNGLKSITLTNPRTETTFHFPLYTFNYPTCDSSGNMIRKTDRHSTVTLYHYIAGQIVAEGTEAGTINKIYVWANGQKVARLDVDSDGTEHIYYLHNNVLGSTVAITNSGGQQLQEFMWGPFGELEYNGGAHVTDEINFTGKIYNEETGLMYFGARFYDPQLGRFITEDPADPDLSKAYSLNRYTYAWNNPMLWVDPDGRWPWDNIGDFFKTVAAVAIAVIAAPVVIGAVMAAAPGVASVAGSVAGAVGAVGNAVVTTVATNASIWAGNLSSFVGAAQGFVATTVPLGGSAIAQAAVAGGIYGGVAGGAYAAVTGGNILEGMAQGAGLGAQIGASISGFSEFGSLASTKSIASGLAHGLAAASAATSIYGIAKGIASGASVSEMRGEANRQMFSVGGRGLSVITGIGGYMNSSYGIHF